MLVGHGPLIVLVIEVPEAELVKRLAWRRVCADCGTSYGVGEVPELTGERVEGAVEAGRCRKCGGPFVQRPDDDATVVRDRLRVYEQQTRPLVDFYKDRPTCARINGLQTPDQVTADLKRAIGQALAIGDAPQPRA
jgi:adenylate kinase